MEIDLRNVPTRWINLDRATFNAKQMTEQFDRLGFTSHERVPGRIIPPPKNMTAMQLKAFGKHFMGCGQAHIDALLSVNKAPLLVLEDDALVTDAFRPMIDVPDDTDAVYLGISHGNRKQAIIDLNNGWYRIVGMLAAHAVLYVSERYRKYASDIAHHCLYTKQIPMDNGFAAAQQKFKIIASPTPMFIQSAGRQSENKWQSLTDRPLVPTHIQVFNELIPITGGVTR